MKVSNKKLERPLNQIIKQYQQPIYWQQTDDGADVAMVKTTNKTQYIVGLIKDKSHYLYEYASCPVLENQCLYSSIALGLIDQRRVA